MLSSPGHGHWDEGRIGNDLGLGHREDVPILSGKQGSPGKTACLRRQRQGVQAFQVVDKKSKGIVAGQVQACLRRVSLLMSAMQVLGAGRPPTEAQMPGWGAWTFLFV